jgi:hypothetical protein
MQSIRLACAIDREHDLHREEIECNNQQEGQLEHRQYAISGGIQVLL